MKTRKPTICELRARLTTAGLILQKINTLLNEVPAEHFPGFIIALFYLQHQENFALLNRVSAFTDEALIEQRNLDEAYFTIKNIISCDALIHCFMETKTRENCFISFTKQNKVMLDKQNEALNLSKKLFHGSNYNWLHFTKSYDDMAKEKGNRFNVFFEKLRAPIPYYIEYHTHDEKIIQKKRLIAHMLTEDLKYILEGMATMNANGEKHNFTNFKDIYLLIVNPLMVKIKSDTDIDLPRRKILSARFDKLIKLQYDTRMLTDQPDNQPPNMADLISALAPKKSNTVKKKKKKVKPMAKRAENPPKSQQAISKTTHTKAIAAFHANNNIEALRKFIRSETNPLHQLLCLRAIISAKQVDIKIKLSSLDQFYDLVVANSAINIKTVFGQLCGDIPENECGIVADKIIRIADLINTPSIIKRFNRYLENKKKEESTLPSEMSGAITRAAKLSGTLAISTSAPPPSPSLAGKEEDVVVQPVKEPRSEAQVASSTSEPKNTGVLNFGVYGGTYCTPLQSLTVLNPFSGKYCLLHNPKAISDFKAWQAKLKNLKRCRSLLKRKIKNHSSQLSASIFAPQGQDGSKSLTMTKLLATINDLIIKAKESINDILNKHDCMVFDDQLNTRLNEYTPGY